MPNEITLELPIQNFPAQQTIFSSTAQHTVVSKGRRFGLTRGAANDFIYSALTRTFTKGLWVDTINGNIDRYVERYFVPHLKKLPQQMWIWRKQAKILEINKSYIDFRSADNPESLEGFGYDKYFINEAGIVLKNPYLWHNAIYPMLLDYNARGVIGGTPKGRGLFYELAQRGRDPENRDYAFLTFSSFDNPYLNTEELKREMTNMPEKVVRQEIYAEFLEDQGAVFHGYERIFDSEPSKPIKGQLYVMGVDLAKHEDFTVITVFDRATNRQVYQARFNMLDWVFQKKKIISVAKWYNNALVVLDATGVGDPIYDDLVREGLAIDPVKITNEVKKDLIEKLMLYIEQMRVHFIPDDATRGELESFTYDITAMGNVRYSAPPGMHDDIIVSLALSVRALFPPQASKPERDKTLIEMEFERQLENRQYGGEEPEFI